MKNMAKIVVQNTEISVLRIENEDYISLTDMAGGKDGDSRAADIIKNWLRARYTLEFLGTWEMLNNPNFKVVEFDHFKSRAGLPSFVLSAAEWRLAHKNQKGNIRDYATMNQLICLANMESLNSVMIGHGLSQEERLVELNEVAKQQMRVLEQVENRLLLK